MGKKKSTSVSDMLQQELTRSLSTKTASVGEMVFGELMAEARLAWRGLLQQEHCSETLLQRDGPAVVCVPQCGEHPSPAEAEGTGGESLRHLIPGRSGRDRVVPPPSQSKSKRVVVGVKHSAEQTGNLLQ